ncbi:MAG: cysteine-rich CWC family protein [Myxococcales bacterium]|nr:cysteine-rich CWC family protein [Myxococcales bacterium]
MAEGSTEACWCVSATIPEWLRARVPEEAEARCICRSCVSDAAKARSDS